jgi:hypothetical protein
MRHRVLSNALTIATLIVAGQSVHAGKQVEFNRDIRPILSDKCFHCHGPDEESREAGLRLDRPDSEEGPFRDDDDYTIIKPSDPAASILWNRINSDDEYELMPPVDSHKEPLTDQQKAIIKQWIEQGAEYEDFWAFAPPKERPIPSFDDPAWNKSRIDRFVMARLREEGLQPEPRANPRTLIRRVTFDLTGLPPTHDEIYRFLKDPSDEAYEAVVDQLLARPAFGEHMARYWLDLVRFADTNGIHHDHYREMTPYRDWVIRAFNQNLSFDKFITYQIAGDLYPDPTLDQQIASGFNRLHLVIDQGTALPEESFARNVVDRVTAFGTVFMGMTVECATCHDHKYDPLTQKDFYQLFAFFNNIDAAPETPGQGIHAPFIRLPSPEQSDRLNELETRIAEKAAQITQLKNKPKETPEKVQDASSDSSEQTTEEDPLQPAEQEPAPPSKEDPAQSAKEESAQPAEEDPAAADAALLEAAEQELKTLQDAKQKLLKQIPVTLVMKERQEIRPAHILIRGAYDQPGEQVERDTPDFLPPMEAVTGVKSRMDLADWLTNPQHPLTARVAVNRFWQQFFGTGIVKTSEDFGAQGEWPSHPQLLDDLALRFIESGWDVKALVKSIVMSETYRQSSVAAPKKYQQDPENRLLARGSRFRLDAEMMRDQILLVSGLLNREMYGKSVKPPQPPDLWKSVSMVSSSTYSFEPDRGDEIYRRSIYTFWKRAMPPPQMTIFDAPTRESCTARRERTNTPLQALVLMNEGQYFLAARHLARELLTDEALADRDRLSDAYELITSRLPDQDELDLLCDSLSEFRSLYRENASEASNMTSDLVDLTDQQRVEIAAHTMLVNAMLNLDITKTKE